MPVLHEYTCCSQSESETRVREVEVERASEIEKERDRVGKGGSPTVSGRLGNELDIIREWIGVRKP